MATPTSPKPPSQNRFARRPKTVLCVTVLVLLGLLELASYLVLVFKGHRDLRFQYRYNRILSGYTVFQNVPHHSFRTSAIKSDTAEADPILDQYGFLSDAPVSREKPQGTFRIFLLGGSAAFGAGQNVRYHVIHPYPDGLYSYPSSIAGRLKAFLELRKPGRRYEVINAAGFERRIHQSMIQYLQSISRFQPDLVINLDGMNDVYSLVSGTPYEDIERQLPFYVDLYRRPHSLLNYSATYYVLSTAYEKWSNRRILEQAPASNAAATSSAMTPITGESASSRPLASSNAAHAAYEKDKSRFQHNADRLMQIVRQYFAVLKADKQQSLFVLQPLLHRQRVNKHLSKTEQAFTTVMVPANAASTGHFDENALALMYFYDDYLSAAIKEMAAKYDVPYLDMNAEIVDLGSEVEFYTDYCHLTLDGNKRVAEILGRSIVAGFK